MKKLITILSAIGLTTTSASVVVACGNSADYLKEVPSVIIGPTSTLNTIVIGQEATVKLWAKKDGVDEVVAIKASSSDESKAKVVVQDQLLKVTGVAEGDVTISLSSEDAVDVKMQVSILKAPSKPIDLVLSNLQLGELKSYTKIEIIEAIKSKNTEVDIWELELSTVATETEASIKVKSGSKIYNQLNADLKVTFTTKPVDLAIIQSSLDSLISGKKFESETDALNAAKKVRLPLGVKLNETGVSNNKLEITIVIEKVEGYVLASDPEAITEYKASWIKLTDSTKIKNKNQINSQAIYIGSR